MWVTRGVSIGLGLGECMNWEKIWDQVSDDELWSSAMRDAYVKELVKMGDSPELAQFRLRQRMNGLREQWAKEHCVHCVSEQDGTVSIRAKIDTALNPSSLSVFFSFVKGWLR